MPCRTASGGGTYCSTASRVGGGTSPCDGIFTAVGIYRGELARPRDSRRAVIYGQQFAAKRFEEELVMKLVFTAAFLWAFFALVDQPPAEAPAAFDDKSNGMVDDATHQIDREKFDEVESIAEGLGPLYNAQSCRECHQDPTSGGASQVTELRVGHRGPDGLFHNPEIPIARGAEIIRGRTLVNDRAICPNGTFPDTEIHERVPETEKIRTFRVSLNLLGDGFVEAVADQTLIDLARAQCRASHGKICGQVLHVPIVEAPGATGVGRFGWKDQHASLRSFSVV